MGSKRFPLAVCDLQSRYSRVRQSQHTLLRQFDALERHFQRLRVGGDLERRWAVDHIGFDEVLQTHGEVLHSVVFAEADRIAQLFIFSFEDQFSDDGRECHDLAGGDATDAGLDGGEEFLGDDGFHIEGQRAADCGMHATREQVQDTADGAWGRGSVDGSEDQVAGFRGLDGRFKRFAVTHFTDEHDVGVFTDGMFHADIEVFDIHSDFALVDDTLVVGEREFDWVFEGEDVFMVSVVDPVEHRSDGGAFAGARDAGEQDHALVKVAEFVQDLGEMEAFEVGDFVIDATSDEPHVPHLLEEVDTEPPAKAVDIESVCEVDAAIFIEDALPAFLQIDHGLEEPDHFIVVDGAAFQGAECAVYADVGRESDLQMEITPFELYEGSKELVDFQFPLLALHGFCVILDSGHDGLGSGGRRAFGRERRVAP